MTLAITIGLTLCIIGALAYGYLLYTPVITAPALKKCDRLLCACFTNRIGGSQQTSPANSFMLSANQLSLLTQQP